MADVHNTPSMSSAQKSVNLFNSVLNANKNTATAVKTAAQEMITKLLSIIGDQERQLAAKPLDESTHVALNAFITQQNAFNEKIIVKLNDISQHSTPLPTSYADIANGGHKISAKVFTAKPKLTNVVVIKPNDTALQSTQASKQ